MVHSGSAVLELHHPSRTLFNFVIAWYSTGQFSCCRTCNTLKLLPAADPPVLTWSVLSWHFTAVTGSSPAVVEGHSGQGGV